MRSICTTVIAAVSAALSLGAGPSQDTDLDAVMRTKLAHAQKLLEAVVTNDWTSLEMHSRELEQVMNDPRWMSLKYPAYATHSLAFARAARALHTAAAQRNVEETPKAFIAVTLSCVECHRYLARARGAQ